jgi:hypothetical protein
MAQTGSIKTVTDKKGGKCREPRLSFTSRDVLQTTGYEKMKKDEVN